MRILGIETTCDETAASIVEGRAKEIKILSNIVASQIDLHKLTGGVVPEVAARAHLEKILGVLKLALSKAFSLSSFSPSKIFKKIDAIAVSYGPGLIGSLLIGVNVAKTLSLIFKKPLIGINHLEAHIYANFLGKKSNFPKFPLLALVVSGGHTFLVLMKDHGKYRSIGETLDDAAGEAFDKVAKILGLPYPGGPAISKCAENWQKKKTKAKFQIQELPRPMIDSPDFNFSFSGLKTAVLYSFKKFQLEDLTKKEFKDLQAQFSFEFQNAVVDVLTQKTIKAAKKYKVKSVCLAGGVAANKLLRETLSTQLKGLFEFYCPPKELCTDNGAIVAINGYFKALKKEFILWNKIKVDPNLRI